MKKIVIPLLCVFMLLGVLTVLLSTSLKESVDLPVVAETEGSIPQNVVQDNEMPEPIQSIGISLDVGVLYTDFESLVGDSEIIVTGTVVEVMGYSTWDVPIQSRVTLEIFDLIKGEIEGDTITYRELGGVMSAIEYVKANEESIKGKSSWEEYEKTLNSLKPTDTYEAVVSGVDNAEVGDRYLLFLRYDFINSVYVVIGMSCNGRFFYDESTQSYGKITDEGTMITSLAEIKELTATTPDNSEKLRAEAEEGYRRYLEEVENPPDEGILWDEIEPRESNPAYGKNGE